MVLMDHRDNNNNIIDKIHPLFHPKHYCNPPHNLSMWFGMEEQHAWIDVLDGPIVI